MVEVIKADRGPRIEIHHIERAVHGNSIAIKVFGEMLIASQEIVYAREMGLNTLQVLTLTPEYGGKKVFIPHKYIVNKGEYDNYATIHVYNQSDSEDATPGRTLNPWHGSIWLDFCALGE